MQAFYTCFLKFCLALNSYKLLSLQKRLHCITFFRDLQAVFTVNDEVDIM